MYNKESTKFNPTLALYMKNVLLKFHSCLYINRGISTNSVLNPRYLPNIYNYDGTGKIAPSVREMTHIVNSIEM